MSPYYTALEFIRQTYPELCEGVEFVLVPHQLWTLPGTVGFYRAHEPNVVVVLLRLGEVAAEYVDTLRHELEHREQWRRGVPMDKAMAELEAQAMGQAAKSRFLARDARLDRGRAALCARCSVPLRDHGSTRACRYWVAGLWQLSV
jgi:hypothetical protein